MIRFVILMTALVGYVAATVVCSDYSTGDAGYYSKMVPAECTGRGGPVNGWRPTYKISDPISKCPNGWNEFNDHCYHDEVHKGSYKDAEMHCNRMQAHIYVPNSRKEHEFVIANVMKHGGWYHTGIWCAISPPTTDMNRMYTNTGEDFGRASKKAGVFMENGHVIKEFDNACAMMQRDDPNWRYKFHHHNCHGNHKVVCEAPMNI